MNVHVFICLTGEIARRRFQSTHDVTAANAQTGAPCGSVARHCAASSAFPSATYSRSRSHASARAASTKGPTEPACSFMRPSVDPLSIADGIRIVMRSRGRDLPPQRERPAFRRALVSQHRERTISRPGAWCWRDARRLRPSTTCRCRPCRPSRSSAGANGYPTARPARGCHRY